MTLVFALPPPRDTAGGIGRPYADGMAGALIALNHPVSITENETPAFATNDVPVIDGLLLPGLLPRIAELVDRGAIALMHHVAARPGHGGPPRDAIVDALRSMLPRMHRVVSTSPAVAAALMADFGVLPERSVIISPGLGHPNRTVPEPGACRILSTGVLTKRKGHDALLTALARLTDLDWTLHIAGSADRDTAHADRLNDLVQELGLRDRVTIDREPDSAAIERQWRNAGLFALTSRWEGYAAGVAQALRRGIPVVVTTPGGSLMTPEAGAVCPLDDIPTLSKVLRRVLFDHTLRAAMADGAWRAGQALPGWPEQAALLADAIRG